MSVTLRSSQALNLWRTVTEGGVRADAPDLTQRQLALLLIVYLEPPPHTVRALAARLCVTKPVITRALDAMSADGLLARAPDPADKRSIVIKRTVGGSSYLEAMAERIIASGKELPL
jgi:DNA-binding MarR family transcriptional regulator